MVDGPGGQDTEYDLSEFATNKLDPFATRKIRDPFGTNKLPGITGGGGTASDAKKGGGGGVIWKLVEKLGEELIKQGVPYLFPDKDKKESQPSGPSAPSTSTGAGAPSTSGNKCFTVSVDTIRSNAKYWQDQSGQLGQIGSKIDGMKLSNSKIQAGLFFPIVDAYNKLVQVMRERCTEGVAEFNGLGAALTKVADNYQAADTNGAQNISGTTNGTPTSTKTGGNSTSTVAGVNSTSAQPTNTTSTQPTNTTATNTNPNATTNTSTTNPNPVATNTSTNTVPTVQNQTVPTVQNQTIPTVQTDPTLQTGANGQNGTQVSQVNPVGQNTGGTPGSQVNPQLPTGQQNGMPTVQNAGIFQPAGAAAGGDGRVTITIGDFDNDGDNEIKVDLPQNQLNHDVKINIDAKIGNEEVKGTVEIDAP